jgi:hypothetical protein
VIPPQPRTSLMRILWRLPGVFIASILLLIAGCISLSTQDADQGDEQVASPNRELTPAGTGIPTTIESSVVLVRPINEPDVVLGSAVVLTADGFLLTTTSVLSENMEIVLPDGREFRPVLVSTEPATGLALLKIAAGDLSHIEFSSDRLAVGAEVFATGFDGSPGTMGRMSGEVTGLIEEDDQLEYRIRGALVLETNINHISGFIGGALSDGTGGFTGILIPDRDQNEEFVSAISQWFVLAWLEARQAHVESLLEAAVEWETIDMPGGWTISRPDGWNINVSADTDDSYRAELTPADPDIPLQFAYSVAQNQHGTDADEFIAEVFEDRSSARIWSVSEAHERPFIRATMSQEGALVDVAYILDETHLVAVSMTSGYQPGSNQTQVDEARALFEAVIASVDLS